MPILGTLLKRGLKLRKSIEQEKGNPFDLQKDELRKLLETARHTEFGKTYNFDEVLKAYESGDKEAFYKVYAKNVPVYNYNSIFQQWWHRAKAGEPDICWPGKVKYFALSSGTSEAATKHIPVTKEMTRAMQRTSIRQILTLSHYDLPASLFEKGMLMLGGSTHLNYNGTFFEGDLSGIQASQIPFWFQHFYKPGRRIAKTRDWNTKLDEITRRAKDWDIGYIVGVPAWIQILMEKIIAYYKVDTIHDIWPNLQIYCHGGVSFEPYKKGFSKLLGRELIYIETYMASEGFIAFQARPNRNSMRLMLNSGIFMEFVPFNDTNFNADGDLIQQPETLMVHQLEEGKDYALLLSTCAGTWRYLIGDVVRMVNKKESEIIITGRTKHFLSLCGEHLSVDNMNKAVRLVSEELNIDIKEFTVAGIPEGSLFAHKWFVGTDDQVDPKVLREMIDKKLIELNDDYAVERTAALKEVYMHVLPSATFLNWMKMKGKLGSQHKFPRVMKQAQLQEWEDFIKKDTAIS